MQARASEAPCHPREAAHGSSKTPHPVQGERHCVIVWGRSLEFQHSPFPLS